jgi:hypothetical protein
MTLHSKMFHKPQTHCSPNLTFADVLNDSYMHTIYFLGRRRRKKKKISRNTRSKVKFEDLGYITVLNILV